MRMFRCKGKSVVLSGQIQQMMTNNIKEDNKQTELLTIMVSQNFPQKNAIKGSLIVCLGG